MKISKTEILEIAEKIKLNINEKEAQNIEKSILEITEKLDEMMEIKTTGEKIFTTSELKNQINQEFVDSQEKLEIEKLNNYQNGFIQTELVVDDE